LHDDFCAFSVAPSVMKGKLKNVLFHYDFDL
jgi:hypothetical protein